MSSQSTVLIVDDHARARETLEALLVSGGYHLLFAASGTEALALAHEQQPDLVLLDVMLPQMDGFEVCTRLRADPRTVEVPIILVTALDDRASRVRGIEAGADDFVSKPFDSAELRARVRTITRLNRYRRLLDARERAARLIELSPHGMLELDQAGTITLVNPALARMVGRPESALLGQHLTDVLLPHQRERGSAWVQRLLAEGNAETIETLLLDADGAGRPAVLHGAVWRSDDRPLAHVLISDLSDQRRADLLEESQRQIAYELHDSVIQLAVGLHQRFQTFIHRHTPRAPEARRLLVEMFGLSQSLVRESRRIIAGLRPLALDELGLAAAMRIQIEALRAEGWTIDYHEALGAQRLPPPVELALFRVVREGLSNIQKHAQTTSVLLSLERTPEAVRVELHDRGSGFYPEALVARPDGLRFGLHSLRDRIALLGGELLLESEPGQGARLYAWVPLGDRREKRGDQD
ncbi:MAG TPA: response regulator [Roseiflexaceae bacterium]|nr:response regulator [Roseiflexaceae bacterium]